MMAESFALCENIVPEVTCKKYRRKIESSEEESEGYSPVHITSKRRKLSTNDVSCNVNDQWDDVSDWNSEITKFVQSLQTKIQSAVQTKTQKIGHTSEKLLKNLANISSHFRSVNENIDKLSLLFNKQYSEIVMSMKEEHASFNDQIDKSIAVLKQVLKSYSDYKTSQKKKLEDLNEVGAMFIKSIDMHNKELKKECNASLKIIKRELQTIQKDIEKTEQKEEMMRIRKSFKSVLW